MLTQAAALRYNKGVGHLHMASKIPVPKSSSNIYKSKNRKRARSCARSRLPTVKYVRAQTKFKSSAAAKPKNYVSSSAVGNRIAAPIVEGTTFTQIFTKFTSDNKNPNLF
jgi:hypothetical protein